ncbi:hypothetical protein PYJP_11010 [Pyrofollis japonicus]|uniref:hypothetical protein n=1 Tax=Pyrofollis japonicus TaxID=3060460 RepID=UPI00295B5092|nr:hypothetical protein [Pyrofollis japonicus]BEP17749.1 hypothetical protein PYJP_11010 [Pyrofollis japonicus]
MSAAIEKAILEEIRSLKTILERIEALLEERLIGLEEPLPDEVKAIKEYENEKRSGKVELLRLEDIIKESVE